MTSTPLKEDHLPNRPIPLIKVISTHNHEVSWVDMKERSFRLHRGQPTYTPLDIVYLY